MTSSLVRNKLNTPVIIKYPFWKYTKENKNAFYACINYGQAGTVESIVKRSLCIDTDIHNVVEVLVK